ncbi:MAG TPA: response regulator [Chthoniobacterales bacterium]|jgi:DNA-binding response OmpR family regulator
MTFLKKILLVDYQPRITALVRRALEAEGNYLIKHERDYRCAVNTARFFQPDLVLFDLEMSRPKARAVARELEHDPLLVNTPVVYLSVNPSCADTVMSAGILSGYSFMADPVRIEEFVRYVGELLKVPAELLKSGYRAALQTR